MLCESLMFAPKKLPMVKQKSVSFYQNSSVWLDILASRSWDRNPVDANPRLYT